MVMMMVGMLMRSRRTVTVVGLRGLLRVVPIIMALVARTIRRRGAVVTGRNFAAFGSLTIADLRSSALVVVVAPQGIWQCQAEGHSYEEESFCEISHGARV